MHIVHHADVAQAIRLTLDKPHVGAERRWRLSDTVGQIYNVADDMPIPISEIRQWSGTGASDVDESAVVDDPWEGIVDTTKIKNELGFQPIYPSFYEAQKRNAL
jgi:nucleoside-diphosphate-sugar epimerase